MIIEAALCLSCFACTAESVNHLRLDIDTSGFLCTEELPDGTSQYLLLRVSPGDTISIVVDYLGFDGVPSCRPTHIIESCGRNGCPTVRRNCMTLDASAVLARIEGAPSEDAVFAAVTEELAAQPPITRDAPDGVVLIRVVGTTEPCDAIAPPDGSRPPYRCDQLLGCGYSCPAQLDEVRGSVDISFDALGFECTDREVAICAGLGHLDFDVDDTSTWCVP